MTAPPRTHARLPRYRRAAGDVSLALTARDLHILQTVRSFRLLTSEHIQALTQGSSQNILRRLQKLFHAGCLDRLSPRLTPIGGSAKMIYAITNKGVATLQKEGVLKEVSTTDLNARNRGLHDFSMHHRLLISSIRAVLTVACAHRHDLELLFWREGRQIYDTIEVAFPQKYAQCPVAPDGFFALRDAQGRCSHFFVEADRGTMTLKRFTQKLLAYAAYWKAKRHTEKFKIKHFRVLTVASSAVRCQNLTRSANAEPDVRDRARMFLFTSEEKLVLQRPESVLEKIWTMSGLEAPCSIVEQSESKNTRREESNTPMQNNQHTNSEVCHGP